MTKQGGLTPAFKEQEAVSLNEGMGMQGILQMMASSQGRSDPIIGQEDVLRGNVSRGDDPSDRFIDNTTKPPASITASSFIEEFATLDIEEQEAYAEAMFAAGYGDNLAIEGLDDIYDPYFISQMLTNGITRAKESFKIGRQNLPNYEGALSEFEDVSLDDVLSKLGERKPEVRYIDKLKLKDTAQAYFNNELGRQADGAELKSFIAGIHAAQKEGMSGQELDVGSRAREFARQADPTRAQGMEYSNAAALAMSALGMK